MLSTSTFAVLKVCCSWWRAQCLPCQISHEAAASSVLGKTALKYSKGFQISQQPAEAHASPACHRNCQGCHDHTCVLTCMSWVCVCSHSAATSIRSGVRLPSPLMMVACSYLLVSATLCQYSDTRFKLEGSKPCVCFQGIHAATSSWTCQLTIEMFHEWQALSVFLSALPQPALPSMAQKPRAILASFGGEVC